MPAAITCFVIGVGFALAAANVFNHAWYETQSAIHEIQAYLLVLTAAMFVCTSFIVAYIDRLHGAMSQPRQGGAPRSEAPPSYPARFKVHGTDHETGMKTDIVVRAEDRAAAAELGRDRGIKVSSVIPA